MLKYKKVLHRELGTDDTEKEQYQRTAASEKIYRHFYDQFHVKSWQEKGEPKSSWYPHPPHTKIYGKLK